MLKILKIALPVLMLLGTHCIAQDHSGTNKSFVSDLSFSKGGTLLAAAEDQSICIYNYNSKALVKKLSGAHTGNVLAVAFSPDSSILVSGGQDGKVILWSVVQGNYIQDLYQHTRVVTSVAFSPDGKSVASGGADNTVSIYNLEQSTKTGELTFHKDDVTDLAFLNDKILISAGADGKVAFWDINSNTLVASFKDRRRWIRSIAVEDQGRYLYTAGDNGRVNEWTITDLSAIYKSESIGHRSSWTMGVDHSSNSYANVFSTMGGLICIKSDLNFQYVQKISSPATKVLFQPNQGGSMRLAVATYGKGVAFIDAKDMQIANSMIATFMYTTFGTRRR
jgi:WD40 repeat protein